MNGFIFNLISIFDSKCKSGLITVFDNFHLVGTL